MTTGYFGGGVHNGKAGKEDAHGTPVTQYKARVGRARNEQGSGFPRAHIWTNMAGCEDDDLASLDSKTINEGAVVELIRRRYSYDKIYVSRVLLERACLCFQLLAIAAVI